MKTINSRTDKINFLQRLQQGKATINELLPDKIELWTQYIDQPDNYINEKTGKEITVADMKVKELTKGNNILFLTTLHKSRHEL